jgi:hypothetical protein
MSSLHKVYTRVYLADKKPKGGLYQDVGCASSINQSKHPYRFISSPIYTSDYACVFTLYQAWSRLKNLLKSKSKFIESKFSEPKSKSVFIESVFYIFVFDFGITSIISKNYDSIYFDTKFNRCYFDKYRIVSVL